MKKFIPFAVAAGLALGGCASTGGSDMSSSANASTSAMHTDKDAAAAIAAAENELKMAKAARNEWRDTGKMIEEAEKAAKAGKYDQAIELADAATRQSKNALIQAEEQKNAGPRM
jgi:hypothetical protein